MRRDNSSDEKAVRGLIQELISAIRNRSHSHQRRYSRDCSEENGSSYESAKKAETLERNLMKALELYVKAAREGKKIDSIIKDFASVLHQLGYTELAIELLDQLRKYYEGDLTKYDKLRENFINQIQPSGKHQIKKILLEFTSQVHNFQNFLTTLFTNPLRIKRTTFYDDLSFEKDNTDQAGRYMLVEFDSFSAAKKTLETFNYIQWFGVNKYWVSIDLNVLCEARDGRTDFEDTRFMMNHNVIQLTDFQHLLGWYFLFNDELNFEQKLMEEFFYQRHCRNLLCMKIIQELQSERESVMRGQNENQLQDSPLFKLKNEMII